MQRTVHMVYNSAVICVQALLANEKLPPLEPTTGSGTTSSSTNGTSGSANTNAGGTSSNSGAR